METVKTSSPKSLLAGRIISILCILFLLFDGGMKTIKEKHNIDGSAALGWPVEYVQGIGIVLVLCTILYIIPRTAGVGAILITGYLGGAISIMIRVHQNFYFPLIFGILVWAGLALKNEKLKSVFLGGQ